MVKLEYGPSEFSAILFLLNNWTNSLHRDSAISSCKDKMMTQSKKKRKMRKKE